MLLRGPAALCMGVSGDALCSVCVMSSDILLQMNPDCAKMMCEMSRHVQLSQWRGRRR